ncbi:MAG TPA: hypothetical protein VFN35_15770 [Ktedonobacteraceae bacterium]|nr:hypothetical protein [Ktedonobacteraceae bacterium]
MTLARLHDGSSIEIEVTGSGPTLLLPVKPQPVEGQLAEQMRQYGNDPALGRSLIDGLNDSLQVAAFDYEGHVLSTPKAQTLTPANVASDLLAVADAVGAERFAYYGYSWLAVIGLQLAIRSDRLSALIMGGYPPLNGPYAEMLRVTTATYEMVIAEKGTPAQAPQENEGQQAEEDEWSNAEVPLSEEQTRQFVTLYQALQDFDDAAIQDKITCPRLCFVGSADEITYGQRWGNVHVSLAGPTLHGQKELEALGWDVRILPELDHTQAMQAAQVLPILRSWLLPHLQV